MHRNFVFRVQPLGTGAARRYQLRIGMEGERKIEFIPVHQSAFSKRLALGVAHENEVDAHLELSGLLEWLADRCVFSEAVQVGSSS